MLLGICNYRWQAGNNNTDHYLVVVAHRRAGTDPGEELIVGWAT